MNLFSDWIHLLLNYWIVYAKQRYNKICHNGITIAIFYSGLQCFVSSYSLFRLYFFTANTDSYPKNVFTYRLSYFYMAKISIPTPQYDDDDINTDFKHTMTKWLNSAANLIHRFLCYSYCIFLSFSLSLVLALLLEVSDFYRWFILAHPPTLSICLTDLFMCYPRGLGWVGGGKALSSSYFY